MATKSKAKGRGAHLQKPLKISTALSKVVGPGPMARTEVVKKIWAYIKRKKIQHPVHRQWIILDEKLSTILKPSKNPPKGCKGCVIMFDMTKQLSNHIESKTVKVKSNPDKEYDKLINWEAYDDDEDEDDDIEDHETFDPDDY